MDTMVQAMQDKKVVVRSMVDKAMYDLEVQGKTAGVEITLSHEGVAYMGICDSNLLGATTDDWNRVLSEGLGTTFTVNWRLIRYSRDDLLVIRLGEPIFDVMRSRGLNPEWDGTPGGDLTITAVDEAGSKLALAMALHSRLGSDSPLSLVSPRPCICCSQL